MKKEDFEGVLETLSTVFYWKPRAFLQKVFRRDHLTDSETWNASYTIAKKVLPVLIRFRKSPRSGYPAVFFEWEDVKECYLETQVEEAKAFYKGGGPEAWDKCLDEMIFAFEWMLYHDEMLEYTKDKKAKEWLLKYGDPFNTTDPRHKIIAPACLCCADVFHDDELEKKLYDRAMEGFKLYHEHYLSLWD